MTQAIAALGVTLARNGNVIAELTSITPVGKTRELINVRNLNTVGGYEEYIGGFRKGSLVAIEGNFIAGDTNGQIGLQTDFDGETAQSFVVTFPTAVTATWTFSGVVTKFETGFAVGNAVPFSSEIQITGAPTLAVTASTGLTTPFFTISESAVIVPAAANATYDYVATVLTGISSVTCTPTATAGVITVNGNVVTTGNPSGAIALGAAGSVTTITIVVTETGKTAKTYTVRVARAAS
jgi:hypothetical protein